MSRLGSFPLHNAAEMLRRHAPDAKVVLDPFCGKGTTLLAARMLGIEAYGIDTGPEAIICSRAKLSTLTIDEAEDYLAKMRIIPRQRTTIPEDVKVFFHPTTLAQTLAVNRRLQDSQETGAAKEREIATTLQAGLLGILHGHASYSLSISSAHAYAMAPRYVRNYAAKNKLTPPERDVKACLLAKIRRCLAQPLPLRVKSRVLRGRAQEAARLFPNLVNRVDCILTSPPYLASHTYAKDNWLRHWLLGFDYRDLAEDYLQTGSLERYSTQMRSVLDNVATLLRPGGRFICVVGHGRVGSNERNSVNLRRLITELLEERAPTLRLESITTERVSNHRRYLHALKDTDGHHQNVRKEYILIATKNF